MAVFATGKAMIATVATRDGDGFAPSEGVASCGDARHACFAVAQNEGERLSTSWATGKVAVAGYYVFVRGRRGRGGDAEGVRGRRGRRGRD